MITRRNGCIVIHRINTQIDNFINEYIKKVDKYNDKLMKLALNDQGNAERFMLYCKDVVVYNTSTDEWMFWDGKVWRESAFMVNRLASEVMKKYYEIAVGKIANNEPINREVVKHARSSCNSGRIKGMLKLAQHLNYVSEMKCDKHLINVKNGVVNLKTKELYPHHPGYRFTTMCPVEYNPDAKSSRFKKFINEIMMGDTELARYLQTAFGYGITGENREEKIFFMVGCGGNGKSKLMDVVEEVMSDSVGSVPISALIKSTSVGSPTPELVPLLNKRIAFSSEIKGDNSLDDSTIKQLTGNKYINIRKMKKEFVKSLVEFKVFVDSNFMPYFKYYDNAIERRVVIIPFKKSFKGKERDNELAEKLSEDKEYVLKWLINGAYRYYNKGLVEPDSVKEAIGSFKRSSDSIGSFVEDKILRQYGKKIKSSELHQKYNRYCFDNDFDPLGSKSFSQEMQKRGFVCKSENSANYFQNIEII